MKIAIVASPYIPVPPAKYGGTELVIYHLIKGLQEQGHEPILLGSGDSKVDCELITTINKSLRFPKDKSELGEFRRKVREYNRNTERELSRLLGRIDIIHSHGFDLNKFQGFPNLTTIHGSINFSDLEYFLARQNLYFVSISKNQQKAYPNLMYMGVIYNGEDPDYFPFVRKPDDYVCFLGRFDRDKNPHLAIQLALNLGIKIKLAGKIDYLGNEYFKTEIKPLLKNPLVEYLGELSFKEKIELISKARCNLHPTAFREPFGLTVLEAAYCGTPTLATQRGSMPELIEEGKTGMLVEDFVEGYHAIEECFSLNRRYIANRAKDKFNFQTMTRQYIRAYNKVLKIFRAANKKPAVQLLAKRSGNDFANIWATN